VCLTFLYAKEKVYLSVSAEAVITTDTDKARELWNEHQQVWWPDGPEDPNLRVVRVTPHRAEMWDGPASSAVAAFEFGKARVTGKKPNLGEKRKDRRFRLGAQSLNLSILRLTRPGHFRSSLPARHLVALAIGRANDNDVCAALR